MLNERGDYPRDSNDWYKLKYITTILVNLFVGRKAI